MANVYGPYNTLNTSGVNLEETYAPESVNPYVAPPPFALGQVVLGTDDSEWAFCQADGAITGLGYVVFIDENFQAAMLSTANDAAGEKVGVAAAAVTDNYFCWIQTKGVAQIRVAASAAANVLLNTTATAGQLDDDGTVGSFDIVGLILTTANGGAAGNAPGILNNPTIAMVAN